jgi:hypothetical protein
MHNMGVGECDSDKIVDVSRKAAKTCFIAHETMDVHKK